MIGLTRREAVAASAGAGAAALLARAAPLRAAGHPPGVDALALSRVNPELLPTARAVLGWSKGPPLSSNYLAIRKSGDASPPPLPDIPVAKRIVRVGRGIPDVTVYVINAGTGARPAILHTHGGGFVLGSARAEIRGKQEMARALGCVIVTVDYALAPEATYAISVEQNYAALKWLHAEADALGVDPKRIALLGESAGGGHAALLAIAARDRGEVPVAFQCLIYPMLDDRTGSARMPTPGIGVIGWDVPANLFGWRSFLGQQPGTARVPAAAVPARTASLAGLPPAFIGVGSIDLFVDEDIAYAKRLIDAGIATELSIVPGAFHGFDNADAEISRRFTAAKMDALRRAFGERPA